MKMVRNGGANKLAKKLILGSNTILKHLSCNIFSNPAIRPARFMPVWGAALINYFVVIVIVAAPQFRQNYAQPTLF